MSEKQSPDDVIERAILTIILLKYAHHELIQCVKIFRDVECDLIEIDPSFDEDTEHIVVKRDLYNKLSDEAKDVIRMITTSPTEVVEALKNISITNGHYPIKTDDPKVVFRVERLSRYLRRLWGDG